LLRKPSCRRLPRLEVGGPFRHQQNVLGGGVERNVPDDAAILLRDGGQGFPGCWKIKPEGIGDDVGDAIGIVVGLAGLVMTVTLILAPIGIPLMIIGWGGAGLVGVWFYVRCVVGIIYLVQDEPYPRPEAWLI